MFVCFPKQTLKNTIFGGSLRVFTRPRSSRAGLFCCRLL